MSLRIGATALGCAAVALALPWRDRAIAWPDLWTGFHLEIQATLGASAPVPASRWNLLPDVAVDDRADARRAEDRRQERSLSQAVEAARREGHLMAQVTADPSTDERRLRAYAQSLSRAEAAALAAAAADPREDADARFAAAQIAAWAPWDGDHQGKAAALLELAAGSPLRRARAAASVRSKDATFEAAQFEEILSCLAIEGLLELPPQLALAALEKAASTASSAFVSDRAHRALAGRRGEEVDARGLNPNARPEASPEAQDREALLNLLGVFQSTARR